MRHKNLCIWLFCFCMIRSGTLFAEQATDIVQNWQVYAREDLSSKSQKILSGDAFLHLREDHSFSSYIPLEENAKPEQGTWALTDSILTLFYELIPLESSIDSIQYRVGDVGGRIDFYSNGQKIATHNELGFESERRKKSYTLHLNGEGQESIILKGDIEILYLKNRSALVDSAFSISDVFRALIGICAMLFFAWLFSSNRRAIDWKLVGIGVTTQIVLAILVLRWAPMRMLFEWVGKQLQILIAYTNEGTEFLFGSIVTDIPTFGYIVAFNVLPIIIFFAAITSILYYLGILQRIVYLFALVLKKIMNLSGAESLAVAGNIFLGQTEAPLLVRPYLERMSRSEMMALMTGGMATIAGSVFAAYVNFLGGADVEAQRIFATHLLTASIMSAPAALVAAKMLIPETETTDRDLKVPKEKIGSNILDAIANGTTDGLKLAINVGVMLLVFTALIAAINGFTSGIIGEYTGLNSLIDSMTGGGYNELNLQFIFGLLFAPIAWLLGVPTEDLLVAGQLLGEKTIINEFYAYATLSNVQAAGDLVHHKSLIIITYALCGFSNFGSIGIQIGGIGAIAPTKRKMLSELGVKSLIGGTIACFMTAAIAGMLAWV